MSDEMRRLVMLLENAGAEPAFGNFWFRGQSNGMSTRFLGNVWSRPSADLPDEINALFKYTNRIYRITSNFEFTIRRTYEGMSNWGFGVYVTNRLDWAKRYGSTIVVSSVDPESILHINHMDFVNGDENTAGGLLKKRLEAHSDSIREQAPIMSKVVKTIKRNAKALFVQTDEDGSGQMCVFSKAVIQARYCFDLNDEMSDENE